MSPRLVALDPSDDHDSRFANDAMVRLWQNAQDRDTGAEAVEALRARQRQEREAKEKQGGRWRFRRGGPQ
jgi:hypothetical protein